MDFKCSVRVQTAIEGIIYFTILIGVGLLLFAIWDFGDSEYNSFQLERTQAGSIQGKYIDSSGSAKSYYVTVRNGRYEADHEVSLVDYNAAKVFDGSKDDLANLGLELRTFNVQDFSDSQGIIRSMGADQAAEIKKEAELAQIKAAEEVAIRQNQLDLKQADLKKQADKAKAEADMVKATVTAEKQRELYIAQQEAEIAAETKKVELAERQADVRERELNATVKKQAEADRYAAEQAAEADLYKRTKQAEAARIERQNASDAELYSAQKDAEGIKAKATAEAEATRLKGEADGASEKSRGEGIAAGVKAQAQAYNGMENPYLLANRYIDIMPKVAEQVAKPLTAVDSIKMYGSGNAQKLVKETTSIVDQVASGLKDSTGIDLPSLLNGLISNPNTDADPAEGMTD